MTRDHFYDLAVGIIAGAWVAGTCACMFAMWCMLTGAM